MTDEATRALVAVVQAAADEDYRFVAIEFDGSRGEITMTDTRIDRQELVKGDPVEFPGTTVEAATALMNRRHLSLPHGQHVRFACRPMVRDGHYCITATIWPPNPADPNPPALEEETADGRP